MTAKSDLPQGTLDLLILKVAALGPVHGYAIAQRLQQVTRDVVQVPQGSLYPALHRLEYRGLLAAGLEGHRNRARSQVLSPDTQGPRPARNRSRKLAALDASRRPDPETVGRRRAMNWWQRLARRGKLEEQLDKEMRFHLDQHTADLIVQGHHPAEARRQARLALGGTEQVKEQCRDARGTRWLEDLWQDFRYAARALRQRPGFTAVSAVTLAIGIGASTAIFSAVNPILFEPLPYPGASRIMMIWDTFQGVRCDVTFHTYRELAARSHSFEASAALEAWQPTRTDGTSAAQPERFDGQSVSAAYFRALGVAPALGRDFQAADDRFKGPHVTILSDALWRRRFAGDSAIVGRQITLDGDLYTVIGVMPRGFDNVLAPSAELWAPLQYDAGNVTNYESGEWGHHLHMVGRLRPGVGVDQARRELNAIARAKVPEFPRPPFASLKHGLLVNSLQGEITRGVKPVLLAVIGAVVLVLLIASVNVTNLLLARGAQRRGEFSMRAALGPRGRD
jgi:putative ABC transport system permease protein